MFCIIILPSIYLFLALFFALSALRNSIINNANKQPYNKQPANKQPYNKQPANKQPYNKQPANKQPYNCLK